MPIPRFDVFPACPEDLDAAWLSDVMRANDVRASVDSFTSRRIGTGQIGENVRLELRCSGIDVASAPRSLVAKFVSPDETSRATGMATGTYTKEVSFYRELSGQLRHGSQPMTIARCWAAEFDAERTATVLILDDLAPARQGDQIEGCSAEQAEMAVRQAAIMHASFWESALLTSSSWLTSTTDPQRAEGVKALLDFAWPGFVERYRDRLSQRHEEIGAHVVASAHRWLAYRSGPMTLVHGDYRLDNVMFDMQARRCCTVDWQTPAIGFGASDIAYFIGSGLHPADRRAHERHLVQVWHHSLEQLGVRGYDVARAWDDYRVGHFSGIIMAIVASMITQRTDRGDEMFWAMAGRHFEAAIDLDSLALLPH